MNYHTQIPNSRDERTASGQFSPSDFQVLAHRPPFILLVLPLDRGGTGKQVCRGRQETLLVAFGASYVNDSFSLPPVYCLGKTELKGQKNCQICHCNHFCLPRCPGDPQISMSPAPDLPAGNQDSFLPKALRQALSPGLHPQGPAPSGCLSLPPSFLPLPPWHVS